MRVLASGPFRDASKRPASRQSACYGIGGMSAVFLSVNEGFDEFSAVRAATRTSRARVRGQSGGILRRHPKNGRGFYTKREVLAAWPT